MKNIKIFIISFVVVIFVIGFLMHNQFKGSYSATAKYLTLRSDTVCKTQSSDKCINNLNAFVSITKSDSSKWVVLVHGLDGNGTSYSERYADTYVEQGYNVLAPDLRGHGSTSGINTLGYLESLDVYDWIKDLNKNWNSSSRYGVSVAPRIIIVHGTSMGAATTLQLATNPDIAKANGSEPYTKNLTNLNVLGFVDDCGYTSIVDVIDYSYDVDAYKGSSNVLNNIYSGIHAESINEIFDLGAKKGVFDKYENVFSDGKKFPSGSKILIIHNKNDSIVPYENAEIVARNVNPGTLLYKWAANEGDVHSISPDNSTYVDLITRYIKCVENSSCNKM